MDSAAFVFTKSRSSTGTVSPQEVSNIYAEWNWGIFVCSYILDQPPILVSIYSDQDFLCNYDIKWKHS
jgi:hypothetical protein